MLFSVVIPVYNEEENIAALYRRTGDALDDLGIPYEVVVVDDGSRDATPRMLERLHESDPRWKVLFFSRNFGHQTAVSAGIQHAQGDVVAVMDGDLQDPPEVLHQLLDKWREGYEVVYAVRRKRKEGFLKRAAYASFYRIFRRLASIDIPLDAGDFCVMDRAVVDVLRSMPERSRFVRGLRSWAGFRQVGVEYERHARQSGEPKYTLTRLIKLAMSGIVSFSSRPLRVASLAGLSFCAASMLLIVLLVAWWISGWNVLGVRPGDSVGWTSIVSLMLLLSGIQLLMIGIVGEYLARVFDEVKGRPAWIIRNALGVQPVALGFSSLASGDAFRPVRNGNGRSVVPPGSLGSGSPAAGTLASGTLASGPFVAGPLASGRTGLAAPASPAMFDLGPDRSGDSQDPAVNPSASPLAE